MHKLQVLNAIVMLDTVHMVNTLTGEQRTTKEARHHKTMFEHCVGWCSTLMLGAGVGMHRSHRHSDHVCGIRIQKNVSCAMAMSGASTASGLVCSHTLSVPQ